MFIRTLPGRRGSRGVTLVEQIIFMVIVSVGIVALLSTFGVSLRHSADPMVRKQMLAVAESLLAEVLHQPFTWCDPDDVNVATASSAAGCSDPAADQNKGGGALTSPTPAGEARDGTAPGLQFDNVADYGGYTQAAASDAAGNNVMSGYAVAVDVQRDGASFGLPADAVLRIAVSVSHAGADTLSLTGYRFRYAPRF